jgi:hypothetical protein
MISTGDFQFLIFLFVIFAFYCVVAYVMLRDRMTRNHERLVDDLKEIKSRLRDFKSDRY